MQAAKPFMQSRNYARTTCAIAAAGLLGVALLFGALPFWTRWSQAAVFASLAVGGAMLFFASIAVVARSNRLGERLGLGSPQWWTRPQIQAFKGASRFRFLGHALLMGAFIADLLMTFNVGGDWHWVAGVAGLGFAALIGAECLYQVRLEAAASHSEAFDRISVRN